MALTAEREAYLQLAASSLENSRRFVPNVNIRSPKAYGGYVRQNQSSSANPNNNFDPSRTAYTNGLSSTSPLSHAPHPQQQQLSETNLYIKNLPPEYSDKDLAALVEGCGKIKSMKAIIDKQTNRCKGFGFIDFESHEDARLAITELQKKGYTAQLAKSSQQQEQDETNLYFANLDPDMTEQDLRQALGALGTVISVRILRDQNKQSRGVGFARMSDREQCQEIINQFNNKTFPNFSGKTVQVKFADASKNKKLYKTGFDDAKNGQPIYSHLDQTASYPAPTVLYPPWQPMGPGAVPVPGQPNGPLHGNPHHPLYGQGAPLRPSMTGFNHPMSQYIPSSHEGGPAFVVPLPVQQLQQLQIANGHPQFCVMNAPHPTLFMAAAPPPPQANGQGQSPHES